ncbi:MAG: hypothetical protein HY067_01425 [Betaproteobacteria bacterium]|nr:hypothetical protein [Betaproteobacteria bacterium]
MAISTKKVVLWRKEVDNQPGVLARTLAPLAEAGANLQIVMGYRFPGNESRAAIEIFPVSGRKLTSAAGTAGLSASAIPTLVVEGDNRAGLGRAIAGSLADAGINLGFLVAQVIGKRYSAVIGFDTEDDLKKATPLIRKATTAKPAPQRKKVKSKKT